MPTLKGLLGNQQKIAKTLWDTFGNNPRNQETVDAMKGMLGLLPLGAGDAASGLLAADDVRRGDYTSAGLNGVGILPYIPSLAGMFVGKNSKVWDVLKADEAAKMLSAGADPKEVWKKTGTFKGADGQLRQEISDHAASARDYQQTPLEALTTAKRNVYSEGQGQAGIDRVSKMEPYAAIPKRGLIDNYKTTGEKIIKEISNGNMDLAHKLMEDREGLNSLLSEMGNKNYGPVSSFLKHGELNRAYPDVYKMHTRIIPDLNVQGRYNREAQGIGEQIHLKEKPVFSEAKSTTLHELQHAIQEREGWARGGSPESYTQQHDAELARDALSWRNELLKAKQKYPQADDIALDNMISQQYREADMGDWLPPTEARDLARQPYILHADKYENGQGLKDLQELVSTYGLDKRTTPYGANEIYRRLAGEAEARATQARMNMTMPERLNKFPFDSYDVPQGQLILRGMIGK